MAENRKAFGIAHFLAPGSTIFYETVTHELQAGRVADLLLSLNRGTKVSPGHLRSVVTLLLSEACRRQVDPAAAMVATDPILLEFGSDSDFVYFGVSFIADPGSSTDFGASIPRIQAGDLQDELELKLHHAARLADRLSFKFHSDTRKVEWVAVFKKNVEGLLHPAVPVEYLDFSGELDASPVVADYRELGDVHYDDVTITAEGFAAPSANLTAEILSAVKPPGSAALTQALAEADAPTIVAELRKDLDAEEMQKLAGEFMAQLESNTVVSGRPDEEDLRTLIKGGKLSGEELVRLIKGAMTPQEIVQLVGNTLPKAELAKLLIDGCTAKVIANMVVGEFPMEELMRIIGEGLPAAELAAFVRETDQERYRQKVEKAAFLVNMGVEPKDRPEISPQPLRPYFNDEDIATILENRESPEKVIQVLSQVVPVPIADAILYGELDQTAIEQTVAQVTQSPEKVKAIAGQLVTMAARIRAGEQKTDSERSASETTGVVLTDKSLERKVKQQERALTFYQTRTRELETLLRAAEDENRKTIQGGKQTEAQVRQLEAYKDRLESELASGRPPSAASSARKDEVPAVRRKTASAAEDTLDFEERDLEVAGDGPEKPARRPVKDLPERAGGVQSSDPRAEKHGPGETKADRTAETKARRAPAAETAAGEAPARDARAGAAAGVEGSLNFYKNKTADLEKKLQLAEDRQKNLQSQMAKLKQERAAAKDGKKIEGKPEAKGESAEVLASQVRELERRLRATEKEKQQLLERQNRESRTVPGSSEPDGGSEATRVSGGGGENLGDERVSLVKGDVTQALKDRVELLEVELRHLEMQKKQWLQQSKKEPQSTRVSGSGERPGERPASRAAGDAPVPVAGGAKDTKAIEHYKGKVQELQAAVSEWQMKYQEALQAVKKDDGAARPPAAQSAPDGSAGASVDTETNATPDGEFERELETDSATLTQGVESITKKFESLKTEVKDDRVQARIDNVMQEVIAKRAELDALGKKLVGAIKRKELEFRQTEATLREEVRKTKEQVNHAQNSGERQKELLARFQKELEIARNQATQATQDQSQYRMKAEHGQRQVDELQKEIERLTRRAGPQKQGGGLSQKEAELMKQADMANKALIMKKQEVEVLKKQLQERATQEAELKKAMFKLQNELRAASKKAG